MFVHLEKEGKRRGGWEGAGSGNQRLLSTSFAGMKQTPADEMGRSLSPFDR